MKRIIDAHIHLEQYTDRDIKKILNELYPIHCTHLISVSSHLDSCRENLALGKKDSRIRTAFGFHPEQTLPSAHEKTALFTWMENHIESMVAIGEIGLPYYLRRKEPTIPLEAYIELLEQFIMLAKKWNKPVLLHAVYEDAQIACNLLEKYSIEKAHFHWFKGDIATIERMIDNGYYISVTPDVLYEDEIQNLVTQYPLENLMVETDGPWQFEREFKNQLTHPKMIHESVSMIAKLKGIPLSETYETLYTNTVQFFNLN